MDSDDNKTNETVSDATAASGSVESDDSQSNQTASGSDAAKNTSSNVQPSVSSSPNTIRITAKKGDKDQIVNVDPNADVKELRAAIANVYQQPPERITIVYAGKILKDGVTVTKAELKDQHTVHVVVRQQPTGSAQSASQQQQQTPSSNPPQPRMPSQQASSQQQAGGLGGLFAGLNAGGAGGAGGMFNVTPETVQQLMNSPLMDNIMANPEVMRMAVQSNPQLRQLMEQNPELNHALSNPDVMRQALQIARNPGAMNEMMRHYDRALSNLEALPGGMNALQRYYNEYQEPMMDAMTSGANPFARLASQQQGGEAADQGPQRAENTAPLPNPWSSSSQAAAGGADAAAANNPFAQLLGAGGGGLSPFAMFGGQPSGGTAPGAAAGGAAENNMMQAIMQQLMGGSAPSGGGGAGGGGSIFNPAPNDMMQAMSNPQVQTEAMRLLNDRRALEAMHTLHEIAPTLFPVDPLSFGGGAAGGGMNINNLMSMMFGASPNAASSPVVGGNAAAPAATNTSNSNTAGTAQPGNMHAQAARAAQNFLNAGINNNAGATAAAGQPPSSGGGQMNNQHAANLAALFSHAMSGMSQGPQHGAAGLQPSSMQGGMPFQQQQQQQQQQQDPATRFRDELEQLNNMGFTNRDANIRALLSTFGDVNAAVDRLLSGGQGGGGAPGI